MKKTRLTAAVLCVLSVLLLTACQKKGECPDCGKNAPLYVLSGDLVDGESIVCEECGNSFIEAINKTNSILGTNYKCSLVPYTGK